MHTFQRYPVYNDEYSTLAPWAWMDLIDRSTNGLDEFCVCATRVGNICHINVRLDNQIYTGKNSTDFSCSLDAESESENLSFDSFQLINASQIGGAL